MDVAAACTKLHPLEFHLVMAKYCDDVDSAYKAMGELDEFMCNCSEKLADLEPQKRSALAAFMVTEFVSSQNCKSCKGTGENRSGPRIVACKCCDGTGFRRSSEHARSRACNVPRTSWRHKGLNSEYDNIAGLLESFEAAALARISRKLA